jgi:two-component system, response regulator
MADRVILLVEDNPDDELLTLRALKKNNVINDVIVVRDGPEALDFLFCTGVYANRDPANKPTLILLDLRLPKVDGMEVLRRMHSDERTSSLPVIILTSSHADRDMVDSIKYGAIAYMQKPINLTQFMQAVRGLGLYLLVLSETPQP